VVLWYRNAVKRLLREIMRQKPIRPGWDIIIMARPEAANTQYIDMEKGVQALTIRAKLLVE